MHLQHIPAKNFKAPQQRWCQLNKDLRLRRKMWGILPVSSPSLATWTWGRIGCLPVAKGLPPSCSWGPVDHPCPPTPHQGALWDTSAHWRSMKHSNTIIQWSSASVLSCCFWWKINSKEVKKDFLKIYLINISSNQEGKYYIHLYTVPLIQQISWNYSSLQQLLSERIGKQIVIS